MSDALMGMLSPDHLTIVVDIGANPIDGAPPYKAMLESGICRVIGFEPQPEALEQLRNAATPLETYLPDVVADGENARLHVCSASGMTSLLQPDEDQLALFNLFPQLGTVLETRDVSTVRLDDIEAIKDLDFLKIDVQGSELTVFSHGRECLKGAVALQTEVSFVPLYVNQPTFGEVDTILRELDFIPHRFMNMKRWALSPTEFGGNPRYPGNQLLEADIVYVRNFASLPAMPSEKIKHLALLAHYVFGSLDLANRALIELMNRGELEKSVIQAYVESISSKSS